jgi:hypothetical protein
VFLKKISVYIFCLFFSIKAYGTSISFPSTLTADTTDFVLVSNSGTGYCGYTADSTSEPEDCAGDSIDATDGIGFEGSQAEVNTAHENTFMIATSLAF